MTTTNARDIERQILRSLAERGQSAIADAAGISETRLSRFKDPNGQGGGLGLEEVARLLSVCGLTLIIVGDGTVTLPSEKWHSVAMLARDYLTGELRGAGK